MNIPSVSFPFSLLYLPMLILFLSSFFPSHAHDPDDQFSRCEPFDCGENRKISYPFRGKHQPDYCGHPDFVVDCEPNPDRLLLNIKSQTFLVHQIDTKERILIISRVDYQDSICPTQFSNTTTLSSTPFHYTLKDRNTTFLYDCEAVESTVLYSFSCAVNNVSRSAFFAPGTDLESYGYTWPFCNVSVVVPFMKEAFKDYYLIGVDQFIKIFGGGFEVVWDNIHDKECRECIDSGGRCGNNNTLGTANEFICLCPDHGGKLCDSINAQRTSESQSNHRDWKLKTMLGVCSGGSALLLTCIITCCLRSKKYIKTWARTTKNDQDLEAFIRSYGHLSAKRYRFSDVKKMTRSFKDKLGQGGYGKVYKGRMLDGRLVAVKILNSSKGNGEEFINEVASISRTSHVNIVTLLGFCLDGHRRALVYEFMPNGSLEKFTYKENPLQTTPHLEWEKLLHISIGIAQGLEYLHHGCNTKILHLDIKPHNILLDQDFCPKISDFGLAKLCPRKDSFISMTNARGTIGYIAPEVFNRNFGGVSSKSDVYSYGMMILEMVGGRKNVNVGVSHTSEIYFPDWIYKHLKVNSNLQLWGDMTSEENEIARKMILVGLWCIQTKSFDRPSMSNVIEMLKGNLEALHFPPNPSMFSPRSPERLLVKPLAESSTTSTSVL